MRRDDYTYSTESLRASKDSLILRRAINSLLARRKRTTGFRLIFQTITADIDLTKGQLTTLELNNCRIYINSPNGLYFNILRDGRIDRIYV